MRVAQLASTSVTVLFQWGTGDGSVKRNIDHITLAFIDSPYISSQDPSQFEGPLDAF